MPMVNQLRLIRMRHANPSITITLIYSSALLSPSAKLRLVEFCRKGENNFQLIEVESLKKECCDNPLENELYENLMLELHDPMGNLGSASDIVRVLSPAAVHGNYLDFDRTLLAQPGFSELFSVKIDKNIDEHRPSGRVLFGCQRETQRTDPSMAPMYLISTDVIFYATPLAQVGSRQELRVGLQPIQEIMVSRYRNPMAIFEGLKEDLLERLADFSPERKKIDFSSVFSVRSFIKGLSVDDFVRNFQENTCHSRTSPYEACLEELCSLIDGFEEVGEKTEKIGTVASIYADANLGFRDRVSLFLNFSEKTLETIKNYLIKRSVCITTGPNVWATYHAARKYSKFNSLQYQGLGTFVPTGTGPDFYVRQDTAQPYENDLSWMPSGQKNLKDSERKLEMHVVFLQRAWRERAKKNESGAVKNDSSPRVPFLFS